MKRKRNLKSIMQHCLYYGIRYIPHKVIKHKACLQVLTRRNSLPLYLAVYPGDVAVQVGTPNMVTVHRFSRLVGAKGKVIVIEADPVNAENLANSVLKAGVSNVKVVSSGAWSEKGSLTLHKSDEYDGDHKIKVPDVFMDNDYRTNYDNAVQIEVDTVDNILGSLDVREINYLSITVNGAEYEVLKGCMEVLRNSKNIRVYSKGHARSGSAESGSPINVDILDFLNSKKFNTVLTRGEKSTAGIDQWKFREGDVFGWKTESGYIDRR